MITQKEVAESIVKYWGEHRSLIIAKLAGQQVTGVAVLRSSEDEGEDSLKSLRDTLEHGVKDSAEQERETAAVVVEIQDGLKSNLYGDDEFKGLEEMLRSE